MYGYFVGPPSDGLSISRLPYMFLLSSVVVVRTRTFKHSIRNNNEVFQYYVYFYFNRATNLEPITLPKWAHYLVLKVS